MNNATKQRYFIQLAFDGTPYHGWQVQPNAITVQGILNKALQLVLNDPEIYLVGAGRTDTGVHARLFYAHFEGARGLDGVHLTQRLNAFLPQEIAIYKIFPVASDSHTRFSALSRTYRYYVSTEKNPFSSLYVQYIRTPLNLDLMNEAAMKLLQYKDFTSFSRSRTQTKTNECDVTEAFFYRERETIVFQITANRFLRNMVRAIVGTLLEVGRERITLSDWQKIIEAKDRRMAKQSAPAQALFLEDIVYPSDIVHFDTCSYQNY